jgi:hypothetical protein
MPSRTTLGEFFAIRPVKATAGSRFAETIEPQGEDAGDDPDQDDYSESERDPATGRMPGRRATHR